MKQLGALSFTLWLMVSSAALLSAGMFTDAILAVMAAALAAVTVMTVMFLVARRIGRYDLVDTGWGLTFIAIALAALLWRLGEGELSGLPVVVTGLVVAWGVRLSSHIFARFRRSHSEDPRYIELRKGWSQDTGSAVYGRIYLMQAGLAVLISLPVIHVIRFADGVLGPLAVAGIAVWVLGFLIESIADAELKSFTAQASNKGKLMRAGLWRYSRHPNYFGELVQWWGIFLIALFAPLGWTTVVGPILISYLIIFVSGIPPSERRMAKRSGWSQYKSQTSAIVPLPPRVNS